MATLFIIPIAQAALVSGGIAAGTTAFAFGTAAATVLGTYIDSTLIIPRLMNSDESAEFGDLKVQQATEGAPYQYGVGPEVRLPAFVAWQKRELIVQENQIGGKGGPQQTELSYFTHVLFSWCRAPDGLTGVVSVDKVWFDGKIVVDNIDEDVRQLGHLYEVEAVQVIIVGVPTVFRQMRIISTSVSMPDMNNFTVGVDITILRMDEAANNGTFRLLSTGTYTDGNTWLLVDNNNVVDSGGSPAAGSSSVPAIFFQNLPTHAPGLASFTQTRRGTYAHSVIPEIEAEAGVGNVPHFMGFASTVFVRLALFDFGNRVPNAEALVNCTQEFDVAGTIQFMLVTYMKLDPALFDVTGVTSTETVRGYGWSAPYNGIQLLQPILIAYDVIVAEIDGVLVFKDRQNLDETTVINTDLGARQAGDAVRIPEAEVLDATQAKIPSKVTVSYVDPDSGYQRGSQQARRPDADDGEYITLDFNLVLTSDQARLIAARILWLPEFNREELTFTLPPKYNSAVTEGTIVLLPALGKTWRVLVNEVARGDDYRLECRGVVEDAIIYDLPVLATEPGGAATNNEGRYYPPDLALYILDIAPNNALDAATVGYYLASAAIDTAAEFFGTTYFERLENEATHRNIDSASIEATSGRIVSLPPDGEPGYFNEDGYIDIELSHGSLASLDEDLVYRGFNFCVIGEELLHFAEAEQPAGNPNPNVWRISKLLRGVRDTAAAMAGHAIGDRFVFIREASLRRVEVSQADIGLTRYYKAVPALGVEDDYDESPIVIAGRNGTTWAPAHLLSRWSGDDLLFLWSRRSRLTVPIFVDGEPPNAEANELYLIVIFVGVTAVVARTVNNWNQPRYIYSRAEQITDGNHNGSVGIPFRVDVRQIGSIGGRGAVASVTMPNNV